jgi:hypothetical protein
MKDKDKVLDYSIAFRVQIVDWKVDMNSRLGREYFERELSKKSMSSEQ